MPKIVTQADVVKRAQSVHGTTYDYTEVNYISMHVKIRIICRQHGAFEQMPQAHLRGQGCPVCGREKQQATMKALYGEDNPMKVASVRDKARQTCLARYGHEWAMSDKSVQEKVFATNQDRYGGRAPLSSDQVKAKCRETVLQRYGVENPAQAEAAIEKVRQTKSERGTFHTSKSEDCLYELLCDVFGVSDVIRQYRSDEYPFACDFYIVSRGLYLELNGTWTHGGHWFDPSDDADVETLHVWLSRDTKYYHNAVDVWTRSDVKKRQVAMDNGLNYVVFWKFDLSDAQQWIDRGCPDGQDWDHMYSWLDESCE